MQKALILLVLCAVGGVGYWYWHSRNSTVVTYRTATVEQGDMQISINATGTLEPEEVVDVGVQVAGQITTLGVDPRDPKRIIDYGSPVEVGTILARIDDGRLRLAGRLGQGSA